MPLPGNTILLAIQETGTYHVAARKERVRLMSITIRRLAQLAGVSHVTVLRALHGRDAVRGAVGRFDGGSAGGLHCQTVELLNRHTV